MITDSARRLHPRALVVDDELGNPTAEGRAVRALVAEMRDRGFLIRIAVGHDAVAALAILWQLVPIFMAPVCR